MVNGYVMAEQFEEDKIFMQPESRKSRKCKSSVLMHIGRPKVGHKRVNAEPAYTVLFSFSVIYDFYQKKQDVGDPIYRNRIQYKGKEYWLADITKIFGVITPIDIQMVRD